MAKGRVYWMTGLTNSGKTTIGTMLYYELKKSADNVVILDGDIMKEVTTVSSEEAYSQKGRLARAKRYSALCKLLSDQGITVIVCTISMFDEVRDWNRKNIRGYIEIFIDAPDEVLRMRDKKGLYHFDSSSELPKNPDILLLNDGTVPVKMLVNRIKNYHPVNEDDFDRDKEYWNQFYLNVKDGLRDPSSFAQEVSKKISSGKHLLELGCGNGRDSLFFLQMGLRVTAIDASDEAVDALNNLTKEDDKALFICDDFVKCQSLYQVKYDYIYSRFTLHAITLKQEMELLENIYTGLSEDGLVFIEARTVNDDLYGKGEKVEKDAFIYNNHYRRFINVDDFKNRMIRKGFEIVELVENDGFSKTVDSNPVLMRCIAKVAK